MEKVSAEAADVYAGCGTWRCPRQWLEMAYTRRTRGLPCCRNCTLPCLFVSPITQHNVASHCTFCKAHSLIVLVKICIGSCCTTTDARGIGISYIRNNSYVGGHNLSRATASHEGYTGPINSKNLQKAPSQALPSRHTSLGQKLTISALAVIKVGRSQVAQGSPGSRTLCCSPDGCWR